MSITYSEIVSVAFRYPACNAHAQYCHLWPVLLYFFTFYHKRQDFRKSYEEHSREGKRARREEVIKENVMLHKKKRQNKGMK